MAAAAVPGMAGSAVPGSDTFVSDNNFTSVFGGLEQNGKYLSAVLVVVVFQ